MKGNKNTNHLVIENPQYAINNVGNYKKTIQCSLQDILSKFVSSFTEYLLLLCEKINMKNIEGYKYIVERGIDTIVHVFSILLYYTKNIDLAFYHSQKAYYFYIEFIEQISDDNVTFLQLSSRDATTFVYKKTIYEINNEYKKTFGELTNNEKSILEYLDTYVYIYKNIIHFYIYHPDFINTTKDKYIKICCQNLLSMNNIDINKNKIKKVYLDCIYLFTNLLAYKQNNIDIFFTYIEAFVKHFISRKKLIDDKIIKQNIYNYFTNGLICNKDLDQIFVLPEE